MNVIEALNWRYATKKMNGQKLPEAKVDTILEAIRLAPSSIGLQPFRVIVVTDTELKKKLQPAAYNQSQIVDCSHLLVFCAWSTVSVAQVDEFERLNNSVRTEGPAFPESLKQSLIGIAGRDAETNFNWAARQAYIALGVGLTVAALEQVDASPMEGFDPAKMDELLELDKLGLRSVSLMALGYRDAADWLAPLKKVRRPKSDLFILR